MRAAISLLVMGLLFASYTQTNFERLFSSRGSGRIVPGSEQLMANSHKTNGDNKTPYRGGGRGTDRNRRHMHFSNTYTG